MRSLPNQGPPTTGLTAVLTRFAVQDLVETLPLALLGRRPFKPGKLPVPAADYYRVQLVVLPGFGVSEWVLMGCAAQGVLLLAGQHQDLARVLDIIGVGMLVPMPPLWLADAALIVTDRFRMPELGFVNVPTAVWSTVLFAVGLHTSLDVPWRPAVLAGLVGSVVYILGASRYLR